MNGTSCQAGSLGTAARALLCGNPGTSFPTPGSVITVYNKGTTVVTKEPWDSFH